MSQNDVAHAGAVWQLADSIEALARRYIGSCYSYGAQGPAAFDCSGFTSFVYRHFGIVLGRSSVTQAGDGRAVGDSICGLQKGDIVVFGGRRGAGSVGHVGIFLAMDADSTSFSFIHSANHGGVQISHLSEPYYRERYIGARRLLPDIVPQPADSAECAGADIVPYEK